MSQQLITHLENTLTTEQIKIAGMHQAPDHIWSDGNSPVTKYSSVKNFIIHRCFLHILGDDGINEPLSLETLLATQEVAIEESWLDVECLTNSYQPYMFEETKNLFLDIASNEVFEYEEYDDQTQKVLACQKEFYENLFLDLLQEAITYLQNN